MLLQSALMNEKLSWGMYDKLFSQISGKNYSLSTSYDGEIIPHAISDVFDYSSLRQ